MEGKRWHEENIQDSLVVQEGMIVKFPLVPVATFAAPVSRFFSSSKKKFTNNIVDIHKDPIMKYMLNPEAPDHLPLATLPCLPERCNHCGKNF